VKGISTHFFVAGGLVVLALAHWLVMAGDSNLITGLLTLWGAVALALLAALVTWGVASSATGESWRVAERDTSAVLHQAKLARIDKQLTGGTPCP
jgi:hypothetical protein